jgi:hypothetical protein
MAVNVSVLNESNGRTGTISIDFVLNILAAEKDYPLSTDCEFYFTVTTNKTAVGGGAIGPVVMKSLSDLALNGNKQSRSDTGSAYTSVTDMVQDYIYDFIHGHIADKYSSGVTARAAMNI